jgi:hypothetical protein
MKNFNMTLKVQVEPALLFALLLCSFQANAAATQRVGTWKKDLNRQVLAAKPCR